MEQVSISHPQGAHLNARAVKDSVLFVLDSLHVTFLTARIMLLPASRFNSQGVSMQPKAGHITLSLFAEVQVQVPR